MRDDPLEDNQSTDKTVFHIPSRKRKGEEDVTLPEGLANLLESHLQIHGNEPRDRGPLKKRKPRLNRQTGQEKSVTEPTPSNLLQEYVYDVYYRDKASGENWEKSQVGYIRLDDETSFLNNDDDDESDAATDDEDSNAEDFYQNDYPDDEDEGLDPESDGSNEMLSSQLLGTAGDETFQIAENYREDESDQEFDALYDELAGSDFERQEFYEDEEEDELAIHRDRIFDRLQKMINR